MIVVTIFTLLFSSIMARLLQPENFGLVAIAGVSLRFFSYFAQMGIVPALIQKPTLEPADVFAAFTISLIISSVFFFLAFISSDLIQHFFKIEGLAIIIKVLALNFIISGFSAISLGLINRQGAFKQLAYIDVASYIFGYGFIGMLAAFGGAGVWTLVAAFMSQSLANAILSYSYIRHPLKFNLKKLHLTHFLKYGSSYSLIGFIEFLVSNIDAMVIGKLMGPAQAGFYNRAMLIANMPVQNAANLLTKVLFPILSTVQNNSNKQSYIFQIGVLLFGTLAFAVGVGIFFSASEIVKILLGNKWMSVIPILKILAWSIGPIYASHFISTFLDSMNQLKKKFKLESINLFLTIGLIAIAAPFKNTLYIAISITLIQWIRFFGMIHIVVNLLKISVNDIARIIISIFLSTGLIIFSLAYLSKILDLYKFNILLNVFLYLIIGITSLVVSLFFLRPLFYKHPAIIFLSHRVPIINKLIYK
jgi:lipopolysaccharide exporter